MQHFTKYLKSQYSLDARSLSLMRICLGMVLLADWIIRARSLEAHYSDHGVMPLKTIMDFQWREGYFSLFTMCNADWWNYFLFSTAIAFAFFFMIGYFTRFSTLISWIMICSIHVRNPFILQAGDELLRIALFWSLFLPLGSFYSVDAKHHTSNKNDTRIFSVPALGLMLLVFGLYFFSIFQKTSPEWRSDGTAIYYALSLDQMVMPLGKSLLNYPGLCKFLTHYTYYLEIIAPLFLLSPFKNKYFRATGIIALIILHLGISITLFVGLFFLIDISVLLGLLSTENFNWLSKRIPNFLKQIDLLRLPAKILPSFSKLRLLYYKVASMLHNFYIQTAIAFFFLFLICVSIIWNLGNIKGSGLTINTPFRKMVYFLRLDENWGMFSPGVFKDDGWFILEAKTAKGNTIDIFRNGSEISYKKPDYILGEIQDDRWRKYGENYILVDYQYIRPAYCRYLFKQWNNTHEEKIDTLKVIYMKETTLPNYQKPNVSKEVLSTCFN